MSAAIASTSALGRQGIRTPALAATAVAAAGLFSAIVVGLTSGHVASGAGGLQLGASDYGTPADAAAPLVASAPAVAALPLVSAPAAAPAAKPMAMSAPASSSTCSGANAAADTFLKHVYAGHLGESAGQQVADASNVNQYALTHTVLVGNMLAPLVSGTDSSLGAFLTHFYAGHLGESPGQQVGDALNVDQYAKTHTVLVGNMAAPLVGTPGC